MARYDIRSSFCSTTVLAFSRILIELTLNEELRIIVSYRRMSYRAKRTRTLTNFVGLEKDSKSVLPKKNIKNKRNKEKKTQKEKKGKKE